MVAHLRGMLITNIDNHLLVWMRKGISQNNCLLSSIGLAEQPLCFSNFGTQMGQMRISAKLARKFHFVHLFSVPLILLSAIIATVAGDIGRSLPPLLLQFPFLSPLLICFLDI